MKRKSSMEVEYEKKVNVGPKREKIKKVLNHMLRIWDGNTTRKEGMRQVCGLTTLEPCLVNLSTLSDLYKIITRAMNQSAPLETIRTIPEQRLSEFFNINLNKSFESSIWIGNHCLDFFIPSAGQVIELNGGIHNTELKMKKDRLRDDVVMDICHIPVMEILNEDMDQQKYKIACELNQRRHIGTSRIRNNWKNIYIETISSCCDVRFLSYRFGYDFEELVKVV
jgi:very-short-patch-repair endonuclease